MLKSASSDFSIKIIPQSQPIWSHSLKDKLNFCETSNVIYQFQCKCGSTYVGFTERRFLDRRKEHVPKWLLEHRNGKPTTSVAEHLHTCNIGWDTALNNFSFLKRVACQSRSQSHSQLKILEALFRKKLRPTLCKQQVSLYVLKLPW